MCSYLYHVYVVPAFYSLRFNAIEIYRDQKKYSRPERAAAHPQPVPSGHAA